MSAKRMLAWGRWLWGFWSASWQENPLVPNKPHQLRIRVHHHVSFHLLYRVYLVSNWCVATAWLYAPMFPSAITRYLVSNGREPDKEAQQRFRFHPLYRGTWYLTSVHCVQGHSFLPKFPSAISRYLVSDWHSLAEQRF